MFCLIKKHTIHGSNVSAAAMEKFDDYDKVMRKFYEYMGNYVADTNVEKCVITALDDNLEPFKTERYERVYAPAEEPVEEAEPTEPIE